MLWRAKTQDIVKPLLLALLVLGLSADGLLCADEEISQSADQVVEDFQVSGFNEETNVKWRLKGETARLKGDLLEVDEVNVVQTSPQADVTLTSQHGYYNQSKSIVLLSKDVKAVSSTGAVLTTDHAVWDTKNNKLETDAPLTITQEDKGAELKGKGGEVLLDKDLAVVKSDVQAKMIKEERGKLHRTLIRCKGPLEVHYKDKIAIFHNDVVVEDESATIYADQLTVYFNGPNNRIRKIVAKGHVKIVKGDNVTESDKAIYDVESESLTMIGEPKVLFYTGEEIGKTSLGDERFD